MRRSLFWRTYSVLLAALLASFGSVFYSPAVSTLMLDIIPRDDMVRGQSIFSSISSGSAILQGTHA